MSVRWNKALQSAPSIANNLGLEGITRVGLTLSGGMTTCAVIEGEFACAYLFQASLLRRGPAEPVVKALTLMQRIEPRRVSAAILGARRYLRSYSMRRSHVLHAQTCTKRSRDGRPSTVGAGYLDGNTTKHSRSRNNEVENGTKTHEYQSLSPRPHPTNIRQKQDQLTLRGGIRMNGWKCCKRATVSVSSEQD